MAATFAVQKFPISNPNPNPMTNPGIGVGMVSGTDFGPGPGMGMGFEPQFGGGGFSGNRAGTTMEIESKIEMAGRVRVLHFFTHHVEARSECKVSIALSDGSVLGVHC